MKNIILVLFIIIISTALFAQAPDTMWTKTFGDSGTDIGYSVQQTSDGGYIITGKTESTYGGSDLLLIKTDVNGDTLWTKTFGDSGWNNCEWGYSVQQTTDEGYIITGVRNIGCGSPNLRGGNIWLIKTDATGDTLWSKTFSIGQSENDIGYSVKQTTDGGYILTGAIGRGFKEYLLDYMGKGDIVLIKTDVNGDTLWTKIFGRNDTTYVFGDVGYCVQQTTEGGYIIAGFTDSYGGNYSGGIYTDIWLIKTDVNGDTLWTKTIGDSGYNKGYSVQQTIDGGYVIAANGTRLLKTDADGETMWIKTFGIIVDPFGSRYSAQQTLDGGYIILGKSLAYSSDIFLIKTNANGDTFWSKIYGDSLGDIAYSVQQTTDGGYIIVGSRNGDVLLIKVAPDITSIDETPHVLVNNYQLLQNYPNPFNPTTTIKFSLPYSDFVTLKIYNILGEELATLVSDRLSAGSYSYEWDASQLASGVYLYRLEADGLVQTHKMILMK